MKYTYYPGCSMHSSGLEYGMSLNYVADKIGMELLEIPDWNCCGASAAHAVNHNLSVALPARNLALAERQNPGLDIIAPCAGCYARMKNAVYQVRKSEAEQAKIEDIIGMPYSAKDDVISLLEALHRPEAMEKIKEQITKPLYGLRVACYYGCYLVRPKEIAQFDDDENPQSMDEIMSLTGAVPIPWDFKVECCGASHQVDAPKAARPLLYNIYKNAQNYEAEAIITACPLCMLNLDMREKEINSSRNVNFNIPVYYFTEILAVAMGADFKTAGLNKHFFPAVNLMEEAKTRPVPEPEKPKGKLKDKAKEPAANPAGGVVE
jgi:heterodisulfide reductase subunit B